MFLNMLNETEKNAFVSLCVHISNVNGEFAKEEKMMIQSYCKEMDISFFDANNVYELDKIYEIFNQSNDSIKRVVLLESLGLAYADGTYDDEEKKFVNDLAKHIGVSDTDNELLCIYTEEYIGLVTKIADIINK